MLTIEADAARLAPKRVFARLMAVATVTCGLLALVVRPLTQYVPAAGTSATLFLAVGVAWFGSLAAALCAARVAGRPPAVVATGLLFGIGARLVVTLALALVARAALPAASGDVLLVAAGVAQTLLLATDSAAALRFARESAQVGNADSLAPRPGQPEPAEMR